VLGFSTKLYLRALCLSVTPNPKVIFIILIIILNLHDSSLSEFGYNIKPRAFDMSLVVRSCYKSVIIKKEKNLILQNEIKKKLIEKKKTIKQSIIPMNSALQGGVQ
jgi:hypothetical protein